MKVLSVDIGGTGIKTLLDGEELEKRTRVTTGPEFTPKDMLGAIKEMRPDGDFDVLAIGLPTAFSPPRPRPTPPPPRPSGCPPTSPPRSRATRSSSSPRRRAQPQRIVRV